MHADIYDTFFRHGFGYLIDGQLLRRNNFVKADEFPLGKLPRKR
jgi:hypothetical protein